MLEHRLQGEERPPEQTLFMIDVPNFMEKNPLWCGWTCASELLHFHGYPELTSEKLFEHVNGEYHWQKENVVFSSSPKPTIDTLALAIDELTDLKPRILSKKDFEKIKERKPEFDTPHDVLQYYIKKNLPSIVRIPGHFLVTRGLDTKRKEYKFNDPINGKIKTIAFEQFDRQWGKQEHDYPRDTSYLMLTISTRKKTPQA